MLFPLPSLIDFNVAYLWSSYGIILSTSSVERTSLKRIPCSDTWKQLIGTRKVPYQPDGTRKNKMSKLLVNPEVAIVLPLYKVAIV